MEIIPLDKSFNKKDFKCGKDLLDKYLHRQAGQDMKKGLAVAFVLIDTNDTSKTVKGYYTLSNGSVATDTLPENVRKKIPYPDAPITLLGRLAIDESSMGQGFGRELLIDALKKSFKGSQEVGSIAVIVDPIDESAISFYEKYGFQLLDSERMFLSMGTIKLITEIKKE